MLLVNYWSIIKLDKSLKIKDNIFKYQENRLGLHRHILCRTGQQPLQACPEGACRSFVKTKNDMGESQNAWVIIPTSISILA
jgi:hypothetical protein